MTDDGIVTLLPGAVEGTGAVQGLRGGYGSWIDDRAHDNTAWASGRGELELDNLIHMGRTVGVPHDLPVQGRPAELTG